MICNNNNNNMYYTAEWCMASCNYAAAAWGRLCTAVCTCQVWSSDSLLCEHCMPMCIMHTKKRSARAGLPPGTNSWHSVHKGSWYRLFLLVSLFALNFLTALSTTVLSVSCLAVRLFTAMAIAAKAVLIFTLNKRLNVGMSAALTA